MEPDRNHKAVLISLHPDERALLAKTPSGRRSKRIALALRVLEKAPQELVDAERLELSKRDAA